MTPVQYCTGPYQIDVREPVNLDYSLVVDKVVSTLIDEATLHKIEKHITLSLYDLVIPSENFRTGKIPRPQNCYIIYRRDFQAKLALSDTSNANATLDKVSKISSNSWKKEPRDVKKFFVLLAECAKEVHKCIFPDYVYNPKKHATTSIPMLLKDKRNDNNPLRIQFSNFSQSPLAYTQSPRDYSLLFCDSSKSPLTLEIKPDFMKSFDEKICKKFDENIWKPYKF